MRGTQPGPRIFCVTARPMKEGTRLNKFLASSGVGSRRACDALVQQGHVVINGQACLNPATHVTADDFVKVHGRRVQPKAIDTIILHKPRGLVCSKNDELNRETIYSLLPDSLHHLNHVGRLDLDSEGLILLTNDGDLANQLLHPSKNIEKEYLVTANQPVQDSHLNQFLSGIYTDEGKLQAKAIERLSPRRFRVVLITGHKRQIRVMFEALGYRIQRLVRVRIGSFQPTDIPPGKWRSLNESDIQLLGQNPPATKPSQPRKALKKPNRKPKSR